MSDSKSTPLASSVLKHLKLKFEEQQKASPTKDSFDSFLKAATAPDAAAALSIDVDTSHPISHYFISSSHNTYLTGNQLWSKASINPYRDVLNRGCRCIEIDVWDGGSPSNSSSEDEDAGGNGNDSPDVKKLTGLVKKGLTRIRSASGSKEIMPTEQPPPEALSTSTSNNSNLMPVPWRTLSNREEPRVLHGYTATKEIAFRSVCEVIRDHAFVKSELPLIVSLEVHCSHQQQEVMVEIMTDYWKNFLEPVPDDFSDTTPLPTLDSLKHKILVKVKYSPTKQASQKRTLLRKQSKDSIVSREDSDDEGEIEATKKGKIIQSLSNLGVWVRACHFDSFDQPEAKIPTHVFALSEKKLISIQEEQREKDALWKHNLSYLMRAYPKGTRVRSSNLDPAPFWRQGVQMVALNWQQINAATMLNDAMFAGTNGWVLKPEGYRAHPSGPPAVKHYTYDVKIQVLAAQHLDQEAKSTPNVFVKVELHVGSNKGDSIPDGGRNKGGEWKRTSAVRHSKDPDWAGDTLEFTGVTRVVPELSFVRIKVMDDDAFQKDRLLGWACFRLDRFPSGLRLIPLRGPDSKATNSSLLLDSQLLQRK